MKTILSNLGMAIRTALVTMILTGVLYPLFVTVAASAIFPEAAGGSFLKDESGSVVGSHLIGQKFTAPRYLHPRPSAAGEGYDANASSGSNLGPSSERLRERVKTEIERLRLENRNAQGAVPIDLATASASGLDPHISPEAAFWQADRIAEARGVSPERVKALMIELVEKPTFGFLGEPRINVLEANLTLDKQLGAKPF